MNPATTLDEPEGGIDGEPLLDSEIVLRLANPSKYQNRVPDSGMFKLSSDDRNSPTPRLSVWCQRLTTPAQAYDLTGKKPGNNLTLRLLVSAVRTVQIGDGLPHLDVEWEPLYERDEEGNPSLDEAGNPIRDRREGAVGHAGIRHLEKGSDSKNRKARVRLAELCTIDWIEQV